MSALDNSDGASAIAKTSGQSAGTFAASLIVSIAVFAVQAILFILIKDKYARVYQPRTYLVPPRERTAPPEPGWWKWMKPVLHTSNSEFVQKCGLDAYFFLRYLRTLLKIFVPAAIVIIPILLPLNYIDGRGPRFQLNHSNDTNVTGLDQLAWGNVAPNHTRRYWAHWLLALALVCYFGYVVFDELRGYIRMRQAYLTSPQHRLRASATTVLVSSIPRKWCTVETLDGLYDVFPGGLRNIWINRNFDELAEKVQKRDQLAKNLETAETDLIKKCFKKNEEIMAKAAKEAGAKLTKEEKKRRADMQNEKAAQKAATGAGLSSGDPHQIKHNVHDATHENQEDDLELETTNTRQRRLPIPILGEGVEAVTQGISNFGKGVMGGLRHFHKSSNESGTDHLAAVEAREMEQANHAGAGGYSSEYPGASVARPQQHNRQHRKPVGSYQSPISPTDGTEDWNRGRTIVIPENDLQPLGQLSPTSQVDGQAGRQSNDTQSTKKLHAVKNAIGLGGDRKEAVDYPRAYDEAFEFGKDDEDAAWRRYLDDGDRATMRLPVKDWMPALPLIGKKVDKIYYCRKEVARLNLEIEEDQAHPERFPLMNSAFIQFNHQVAAHMACQSLSHHVPKQMAPRLVEIDPKDVIWSNMAIPWWQRYIRTAIVISIVFWMIVLWAIPVAFTGSLSQLNQLAAATSWLHWILKIPVALRNVIQGVLPATFLAILMFFLPLILRSLSRLQGTPSGMLVELSVQKYYFFFLFIQLFLVVSVSTAATTIIKFFTDAKGVTDSIPTLLTSSIPRASNYFFSYMLLQALSVSAGALVQVGGLLSMFVFGPLLDNTARAKFNRRTNLSDVQWGTFFPVYTNLACIGFIYSCIAPLIIIFNIITFTLFWFVYRYNTLYVTKFTRDTGGLLFPNAINSTFTGVYFMELLMALMFIAIRDENGNVACKGQFVGMLIILILTAIYQYLIHEAFAPLYRYLPITLEDDAVRRDEEFARAMHRKEISNVQDEIDGMDLEDHLENQERQSREEDHDAQEYEMRQIQADKQKRLERLQSQELPELEPYKIQNPEIVMALDRESKTTKGANFMKKHAKKTTGAALDKIPTRLSVPIGGGQRTSWADRSNTSNRRSSHFGGDPNSSQSRDRAPAPPQRSQPSSYSTEDTHRHNGRTRKKSPTRQVLDKINNFNPLMQGQDLEQQRTKRQEFANTLFGSVQDELEDLTAEERDALVQRAFQHEALRATRPCIWLPNDELGVGNDEVLRMRKFSRKHLWVSNDRQTLDAKGRCYFQGAPPDFSEVDVIQL